MSERAIKDNLIAVAETYAKATNLSLATVSGHFHGNQAFLEDFKTGKRSIILSKLFEMLNRFRQEWPRGVKWPPTKSVRMGRREAK